MHTRARAHTTPTRRPMCTACVCVSVYACVIVYAVPACERARHWRLSCGDCVGVCVIYSGSAILSHRQVEHEWIERVASRISSFLILDWHVPINVVAIVLVWEWLVFALRLINRPYAKRTERLRKMTKRARTLLRPNAAEREQRAINE